MVEAKDIAQKIQADLNALTEKYRFAVTPLAGDYVEREDKQPVTDKLINAVLRPLPSSIVPIKDLNNFYMIFNLEFAVKKKYINDIAGIIQQFVNDSVGAAARFGEFVGIVNCDVPMVGAVGALSEIGQGAPILVTMYYQFIKSGVLSNECKFEVNGETLLVLEGGIARSRVQQTENILNDSEMRAVVGQQGITIQVTVPYLNKPVTASLANDIVHGNLNKTYELVYDDGVVKVGSANYKQRVVLTDGTLNYQSGKIVTITLKLLLARTDIYAENTV